MVQLTRFDDLSNEQYTIVVLLVNYEQERPIANEFVWLLSIHSAAGVHEGGSCCRRLSAELVHIHHGLV